MDYLIALDEHRDEIETDFGVDVRRASATVLVGHPGCHPELEEGDIDQVFRVLSANLNRIEVRTYKDLLDSAQRTLAPPMGRVRR